MNPDGRVVNIGSGGLYTKSTIIADGNIQGREFNSALQVINAIPAQDADTPIKLLQSAWADILTSETFLGTIIDTTYAHTVTVFGQKTSNELYGSALLLIGSELYFVSVNNGKWKQTKLV